MDLCVGIHLADAIASAFPHTILTKVNGTPSRVDIDDAQDKQTENAASRPSTRGGGGYGHAGMVVPFARYIAECLPTAYLWEVHPGEAPNYPHNIAVAPQHMLDNNFARANRVFKDQSGTHIALKNQCFLGLNPAERTEQSWNKLEWDCSQC